MRASTCHDGLRRHAVGGERMDGEVFFSGLIFGLCIGVVLGYYLPHRLPPREEKQPEIERLVEQFQELFREIEKQPCIGGVCITTGTIPSKTFREAVCRLSTQPQLDNADTDA